MSRSSALAWVLVGGLGIAFIVLLARQDAGTVFGMPNAQFAQVAAFTALAAFLGAGLLGRGAFGRSLRHALVWAIILIVLVAGYTYRSEIEWVGRRMTAELFPGHAVMTAGGDGEQVVVSRVAGGHFGVVASVNSRQVPMMVDTGASVVTLTAEDAEAAGVDLRGIRYSIPVATANGTARAAPVLIDTLAVGSIERHRVPALVTQPGMLDSSLLGMSFLDTLGGFSIRGDQMILTP